VSDDARTRDSVYRLVVQADEHASGKPVDQRGAERAP
jgi:hypothetical protein